MPDHIHLALRLRDRRTALGRIIAYLRFAIRRKCSPLGIDIEWQRGFFEHVVRDYEDSSEIVKYLLLNPVRAGLADELHPYEFAGAVVVCK